MISQTFYWQLEKKRSIYFFQTNDYTIFKKMKRRKNFHLVSRGLNCKLWIFSARIGRPSTARKIFKTLTGQYPIYVEKEDLFANPGFDIPPEKFASQNA